MANEQIKEARIQFDIAKAAVTEAEQNLSTLKAKREDLSGRLKEIDHYLDQAKDKKRQALQDYAIGRINEEALSRIREESQTLERERAEKKEMLEAIEAAINRMTPRVLAGLQEKAESKRRALWRAIDADLQERRPEGLIEYLERLRAAQVIFTGRYGSIHIQGVGTLTTTSAIPTPEENRRLSEITAELEARYLK